MWQHYKKKFRQMIKKSTFFRKTSRQFSPGVRTLEIDPWVMAIISLFLVIIVASVFLPAVRSFIIDLVNNLLGQLNTNFAS